MKMEEKKSSGKKNIILIIVAAVIMIGVIAWYSYYSISSQYFKTNNAKVSATMYSITPAMPGKLVKLTVGEGDKVSANEIIGRVEGGAYLKSPVDGEVIDSNVKIGQMIGLTTVVAVIADESDVCIKSNIEETDIEKIKEGQKVVVTMDAFPGKTFHGHVKTVDKLTQTALSGTATSFSTSGTYTKVTQLIPVKIAVDDDVNLENIIGTNATVKIKVK